jgi:tRNA modification GTPase
MDLTEAEGLADLINSETEAQRRQALRQMDGYLSKLYDGWRAKLLTAMAHLEADIDFADEEIPDDVTENVKPLVIDVSREITAHLEDGHRGERLREGLQVVILGEPNIGKSTLLNYLSRRDVAIVSDIAGTTRDLLEVHLDLAGFPVTIVDTAGLREANDVIEAEGIRRAEARAEKADLKLLLLDAAQWSKESQGGINPRTKKLIDENTMILLNKSDLQSGDISRETKNIKALGVWPISAKYEDGIDEFIQALEEQVERRMDISDMPCLTRNRHRLNLAEAMDHIERFIDNDSGEIVLLAEDLRMAARSLGKITGQVDVEEILGKIFSEFCIGK